jgi:hypothetical protein
MPQIYERYHAIASRRKLSLLAHGPNPCHFLSFICIMSILFKFQIIPIISKTEKCNLSAYSLQKTCQSAQPPLAVSEHTNQEHKGLNHQAPRSILPWWQLMHPAHRNRSHGCMRAIQSAIQI